MDWRSRITAGETYPPSVVADGAAAHGLADVRIHVLRNFTVDGIEPLLKRQLGAIGYFPKLAFGGYGTMMQDALAHPCGLVDDAELLLVALTLDELDREYGKPGWTHQGTRDELGALFDLLASRTRATIVVNTFLPPLYPEHGLWPTRDGSDTCSQVAELNSFVLGYAREHAPQFVVADFGRYLALLGADAALDERGRYLWRAPFRQAFLERYARDLVRIVRVSKGRLNKCLILDCDNTLWGGVVGEDGIGGIKLDGQEYPGRAFYDFHTAILGFARRGVILALSSKNNAADVMEILTSHPHCQLRPEHFAAMKLDWRDKATNIRELAEELNLGLDSFVFVDDNPNECELIRTMLPEVTVLAVPEHLHELPGLLHRHGLFDSAAATEDDAQRTERYRIERQRLAARSTFATVDEYLGSLGIVATIEVAQSSDVPRIAQLTQKTNQFNLTTRRYTEQAIRHLSEDNNAAVFVLSAKDRFGSLGLVGVMILERKGSTAVVDTLLLSCRALGRNLEHAFAGDVLKRMGRQWDVEAWEAKYVPTAKNSQVRDFWKNLGFDEIRREGESVHYRCRRSAGEFAIPAHVSIEGTGTWIQSA